MLVLSFLCSVLWLLPPFFKSAISLYLSNCASCLLLVSSLAFPPFLNDCVPLSVRLHPQRTIHHPTVKSLTAKTKKGLSEIGAPENKERDWPNTGFHRGGRQERTLKRMKKTAVMHCRWGEMCSEMMCSEWIVSQAASEGGDGGGKVWGRQKSVVMMRRRKERKKQNRFSIAEFLNPPTLSLQEEENNKL